MTDGCPWDEKTFKYATQHGRLDILKWLKENGCPWDEDTFKHAALWGHNLEVLDWLKKNNCPYSMSDPYAYYGYMDPSVNNWVNENLVFHDF